MKSFFIISLFVFGVRAGPSWTQCYMDLNLNGYYLNFDNYAPSLYEYDFDNVIDSVRQTGMWMYYENEQYNLSPGSVYFVHGVDIVVNFPYEYRDKTSSLRYIGSPSYMNADTISFFEGTSFTAREYYTDVHASNFGQLTGHISSLVVTGRSPWTIYSRESYAGDSFCVYPNTDHDVGPNGETLDFGIYPNMASLGVPDNSIRSVEKGCWSKRIITAPKLNVIGQRENGAWGRLE